MDELCCYAASFVCHYLFSGPVFLLHVVSAGLLYSMARQNSVDVSQFVNIALKMELTQLILWLVIPIEGLSSIAALYYCLTSYESATGQSVVLTRTTRFLSG